MSTSNGWDLTVQQFHGGQDWQYLASFVEDFSVTTNGLGTPQSGLDALPTIDHYPAADQEPALSSLATFLWPNGHDQHKDRLILGNGASELIDLVIRYASLDGPWKCGPWLTQYKEYERSAKANGRVILSGDSADKAAVLALINPCNPTGDYMSVDKVAAWILENALPGATVLVDESMQPWHGPQFRDDSLASSEWVKRLHDEHGIHVYVIHSWTKLWSCTGIRLGSVVTPTAEHAQGLKRIQVPWSVNCLALAFLDAVTRDHAYLDKTWQVTPEWRALTVDWLTNECKFKVYGEPFLSWVLVNVDNGKPCRDKVEEMVKRARAAGVPVRDCRPGYYLDSYVRVAVRDPSKLEVLKQAWKGLENE